ncbi:MAG: helix-turn-helix domain-containing protein [Crocosphaera sp.]|nr:helix-turn-helix domain-containing protein [Crocosphaera sp.]
MFIGTTEAAKRLGISTARLRVLLKERRVEGAYKIGKTWLIPLYNGSPVIARRKRGPKPKWKTKQVPAKSQIYVNRHVINDNKSLMQENPDFVTKQEDIVHLDPVFSVKLRGKNTYGHEIQINGPCRLIYRPDAPQCFGATVWIETLSPVNVI